MGVALGSGNGHGKGPAAEVSGFDILQVFHKIIRIFLDGRAKSRKVRHACEGGYPELFEIAGFLPPAFAGAGMRE